MISSLTCLRFEPPYPHAREHRGGWGRSRRSSKLRNPKESVMRLVFVSSVLTLLALNPAVAQSTERPNATLSIGNPGFAAPGTKEQAPGVPAPHQANVPDQVFVIQAI